MARLTLARKIAAITLLFAGLEERSPFRRRTSETTSSLSVCGEPISIPGFISRGGLLVLVTLWFEGEYP
jgi:hypothetical protein